MSVSVEPSLVDVFEKSGIVDQHLQKKTKNKMTDLFFIFVRSDFLNIAQSKNYLVLVRLDARHNRHVRPEIEKKNSPVKFWQLKLTFGASTCSSFDTLQTYFEWKFACVWDGHIFLVKMWAYFHVFFPTRMQIIIGAQVVKNALKHENNTHPTCKLATWFLHVFEGSDNRKGLDANGEGGMRPGCWGFSNQYLFPLWARMV